LVEAICVDLKHWRQWGGPRRVGSIHFGGGTPSLLSPAEIAQILTQICALWDVARDCEIALEANPNDANAKRWEGYARAGVNRLSLGVQSFHGPALKRLGRDHSGAEAKAALRLATEIFPRISADVIYGWAGQDEALLRQDLEALLDKGIGHISAYQLTIEDGTAFGRAEARGDIKAVDADTSAGFYDFVRGELLAAYQTRIGTDNNGIEELTALTPQAWGEEYVLMGLRIDDGIALPRYTEITGKALPQDIIDTLIGDGLLEQKNTRLMASAQGRIVLNRLTDMLLLSD